MPEQNPVSDASRSPLNDGPVTLDVGGVQYERAYPGALWREVAPNGERYQMSRQFSDLLDEIAALQSQRDIARSLLKAICDEWQGECRPGCDSYGHEADCTEVSIAAYLRSLKAQLADALDAKRVAEQRAKDLSALAAGRTQALDNMIEWRDRYVAKALEVDALTKQLAKYREAIAQGIREPVADVLIIPLSALPEE